jgi:predicted DsbA family dithiol-disulfide isomerase
MEIVILYSEQLKDYTSRTSDYLTDRGYRVTTQNVAEYEGAMPITTVPTFLIRKAGKEGYLLKGKQPLDVILNWAKNSGIGND